MKGYVEGVKLSLTGGPGATSENFICRGAQSYNTARADWSYKANFVPWCAEECYDLTPVSTVTRTDTKKLWRPYPSSDVLHYPPDLAHTGHLPYRVNIIWCWEKRIWRHWFFAGGEHIPRNEEIRPPLGPAIRCRSAWQCGRTAQPGAAFVLNLT